MTGELDPIIERLNDLTKKVDTLTKVLASKPNGEQITKLLKGKVNKEMSQKEQIRTLREFDFPNEIIALMIGTTTETVRVSISQMKSEEKKPKKPKKPKEESKNEQQPTA